GGHIGRYVARQCKRARTVVEENGTRRAAAGGELPIAIRTVTITGIVQIIGKLVHRREPDGVGGRVSGAQGTRLADIADRGEIGAAVHEEGRQSGKVAGIVVERNAVARDNSARACKMSGAHARTRQIGQSTTKADPTAPAQRAA